MAVPKRFRAKTLRSHTSAGHSRVINTDTAPALAKAIAELKEEGICPSTVEHRQVKYLQQRSGGRSWPVETNPGAEGGVRKPDAVIVNRVFETA